MDSDPDEPDDRDAEDLPASANSVDEVIRLLEWSRKRGFSLKSVRVGHVVLEDVRDLRPHYGAGSARTTVARDAFEDIDPSIYKDAQ